MGEGERPVFAGLAAQELQGAREEIHFVDGVAHRLGVCVVYANYQGFRPASVQCIAEDFHRGRGQAAEFLSFRVVERQGSALLAGEASAVGQKGDLVEDQQIGLFGVFMGVFARRVVNNGEEIAPVVQHLHGFRGRGNLEEADRLAPGRGDGVEGRPGVLFSFSFFSGFPAGREDQGGAVGAPAEKFFLAGGGHSAVCAALQVVHPQVGVVAVFVPVGP